MTTKKTLSNVEVAIQSPLLRSKYKYFLKYMKDESLMEIRINKEKELIQVFANGSKKIHHVPELTLTNLKHMSVALAQMNNKQKFNEFNPILSCKFPGGHRTQIMGFDSIHSGFAFVMRMNKDVSFPLKAFGVDAKLEKQIINMIKNKKTLLVSGGTSTGKTTLTNELIQHIPENERLISIEGVQELKIPHVDSINLIYSENETSKSGVDANDLLRASLRLTPDRILVGEIHNENAMTFLNAINTGHEGSIATVHANDPEGAVTAVIQKIIVGGAGDSAINVLQKQICEDVYGVIQITKDKDQKRKAYFEPLESYAKDIGLTKKVQKVIENQ